MITKLKAIALWQTIQDAKAKYRTTTRMPSLDDLTTESVDDWLKDWRECHLTNKYMPIEFDGRRILICQKTDPTLLDITARGIDMARAAAEFLNLNGQDKETLIQLIVVYLRKMQRQNSFAGAVKEVGSFNGALVSLLCKQTQEGVTSGGAWDRVTQFYNKLFPANQARKVFSSLRFLRDFLWQKDFVGEYCVLTTLDEEGGEFLLRYAQPLTYPSADSSGGSSPWNNLDEQPWLKSLHKKYNNGPWFAEFVHKYKNVWARLSSTPMNRVAPNPANAVAITDIFVKSDEVTVFGQNIRTAVTEPIDLPDKASRQAITNWNHQQLIIPHIEEQLNHFVSLWGRYYPDGPIPLTLMHQTLIGDEVAFTPDQQKATTSKIDGSVIDSKTLANERLHHIFTKNDCYYHPERRELKWVRAGSPFKGDGFIKVDIKLLETNHCINMWEKRARVRNQDINDSRELLNRAQSFFERVLNQHDNEELRTVLAFLNSNNHSFFTPYKRANNQVKSALVNLSQSIKEGSGSFSSVPNETRHALALSLQAAVELKCLVHETWAGSARRNISNWSRNNLRKSYYLGFGHLADIGIRISLSVLAFFSKAPMLISHIKYFYKHRRDRETVYLSAYEGILAEQMGMLMGGCMSAVDRAGEIAEFRAALKKQYMKEGEILSFDSRYEEKKAFLKTYGDTSAKHVQGEMATGSAGTKDKETEGYIDGILIVRTETEAERKAYKQLAKLRVGSYADVSYESYLLSDRSYTQSTARTVGEKYPQATENLSFLLHEEDASECNVWKL